MSPARLQTEHSHFDTCAPRSPAGKRQMCFLRVFGVVNPLETHFQSHTITFGSVSAIQPPLLSSQQVVRPSLLIKTAKVEENENKQQQNY